MVAAAPQSLCAGALRRQGRRRTGRSGRAPAPAARKGEEIKSPMVGTMLSRRPSPVHARLHQGRRQGHAKVRPSLIVEAMKTMNPIPSAARRHDRWKSLVAERLSPSSLAKSCWSSSSSGRVRQDSDSQPRRNRPSRSPGLQGNGHPDGHRGGPPPKPTPMACGSGWPTKAVCIGPAPARQELSEHPLDYRRCGNHRGPGYPSRLRLPLRERPTSREIVDRSRHTLSSDRAPEHITHDGRQDRAPNSAVKDSLGIPVRSRLRRRRSTDRGRRPSGWPPPRSAIPVLIKAAAGGGGQAA